MLGKNLIQAAAGAGGEVLGIEDVFSTWLYTGNAGTQKITNGIDLTVEGGMVWLKSRSSSGEHGLFDTVRGVNNWLRSNGANANSDLGPNQGVNAFYGDGFDVAGNNVWNGNGQPNASWTFRKAAKFFDVVTWTGDGTDGRQIAHNLGSNPGCVIIKRTDSAIGWAVYHRSRATTYGELNSTNAFATSQLGGYNMQEVFGNSSTVILPNSSNITVARFSPANASGGTYVAYLFAHDAGGFGDDGTESVIKCGSYTGNNGSPQEIDLGWEPQWLLVRSANVANYWDLSDNMRGLAFTLDATIYPNASDPEDVRTSPYYELTPTGFKLTGNANNASNYTYIYIAIRRGPMKTPTDATKVLTAKTRTGTGANTSVTNIGFSPDLVITKTRTSGVQDNAAFWFDRVRGNYKYLISALTNAEGGTTTGFALAGTKQETADIAQLNNINRLNDTAIDWFFRRAPGFFDVVAYTGTGSAMTVSHNLGVAPELMIVKRRDTAGFDWRVYSATTGAGYMLTINSTAASTADTYRWNNTAPTSTVFSVGTSVGDTNVSGGTYIAYLFASCPGVSKVGSYTGTGTTKDIDCGFTAGSRLVLIKRTDSTGNWYIWDSARGIVSGNDPYLLLNSTAAEVTNTDYIDPLSSGFQISSTAPAEINANGGSYIFLAIA